MFMKYKLYCKSHFDYYKYYFISNFNLEESLILNFLLLLLCTIPLGRWKILLNIKLNTQKSLKYR